MRDAWFALTWLALLPMTVISAHVGVLLWIWVALISPNEILYGVLAGVPFNKLVAITTMVSLPLNQESKDYYFDSMAVFLSLFAVAVTVSWFTALVPGPSNDEIYQKILKELVLYYMITVVMMSRQRIHSVLIAIVLSIGFFSIREGLIFALTAGGHKIVGSGAIGDNNALATVMLMIIPILYYLYTYSALGLIRIFFAMAIALGGIAVVGTYSRGGFLGMLVAGLFMFKNSRNKWSMGLLVITAGVLVYYLGPEDWFERLNTINAAGEDSSFMGRVGAWKMSILIALDRPLTDAGPHSLQRLFVWEIYRPFFHQLDFIDTPPADLVLLVIDSGRFL